MTDDTNPPGPSLLRSLRVEPPRDEFVRELHLRLASEPAPAPMSVLDWLRDFVRAYPMRVGAGVGLAVGVSAFLFLARVADSPAIDQPAAPQVATLEHNAPADAPPIPVVTPAVVDDAHVFEVPVQKVAVIELAFTAEVRVEDVDFQITLPEGVRFWSDGEMLADRSFEWQGGLDAGENTIPVAVRATSPGRYRVIAQATIGAEVVTHEIVLEVEEG
jgi:hypothetical protein